MQKLQAPQTTGNKQAGKCLVSVKCEQALAASAEWCVLLDGSGILILLNKALNGTHEYKDATKAQRETGNFEL